MSIVTIDRKRVALYGISLTLLAGCYSFSSEVGYREDFANRIVPGITSKAQVLELLGPPTTFLQQDGLFQYQYKRSEQSTIPLAKEIVGEMSGIESTLLIIDIDDKSGIVLSVERRVSR